MFDASDRYEVSVQQLMSCNTGNLGCNGGSAGPAASALVQTNGIAMERDFVYQCGSGNPLNHFDGAPSCTDAPWGATCAPEKVHPGWFFRSASQVSGEAAMKNAVASGSAVWFAFLVPSAFMTLGSVPKESRANYVFDTPCVEGETVGGHAVIMIGYGSTGGKKYWQIQNSWGHSWFDNGYAKVIRGVNWCGSENGAFVFQAWVQGGTEPPCLDAENTGLFGPTGAIPCSEAKGGMYGNLCASQYASTITSNCPQTCGVECPKYGSEDSSTPEVEEEEEEDEEEEEPTTPTSAPTAAPTPAPTSPPTPFPTSPPTPAPTTPPSGGNCATDMDIFYQGKNFFPLPSADSACGCMDICASKNGAVAWSWRSTSKKCYCKKQIKKKKPSFGTQSGKL
jgi:hypothetical protein